jgi:hypothetical protein
MGLRPLACWDCGFESRRGHGCLYLVSVVCSRVEVSASGWSLVQRSLTECGVSDRDRERPLTKRPWSTRGCCVMGRKINSSLAKFELILSTGFSLIRVGPSDGFFCENWWIFWFQKNKSESFSVSVLQNFTEKYLFCHLKPAFGYKEVTVQYVTNSDVTISLQ